MKLLREGDVAKTHRNIVYYIRFYIRDLRISFSSVSIVFRKLWQENNES